MESLFIVALPRTYSTQVFQHASRALALTQPSWVLDGEILNVDRYWHYQGTRFDESAKFTLPEHDPLLTGQLHEFLDQTVQSEGFVYKDVIQPFVVSQWRGLSKCRVLVIRRNVAEIAYSMLRQGWFYPRNASRNPKALPRLLRSLRRVTPFQYQMFVHGLFRRRFEEGVIEGLVRAECALATIDGEIVDFGELVYDEQTLVKAIYKLYGVETEAPRYIDEAFIRKRERIERRRQTSAYRRIEQMVRAVRERT